MNSLKDVNNGLADAGIPAVLSPEGAKLVIAKVGREDFITSLSRACRGDIKARGFVEFNLAEIGLLGGEPENQDVPPEHAQEQPTSGTDNGNSSSEREYLSHHVYGKDALCFQVDKTKGEFFTIRIDGAKAAGGNRKNWDNKISIQLTKAELPIVMGVLMRVREKCEFKAHGPNKDKGFSLEVQGENVFCRMFAKDKPVVNVPIPYSDRVHTVALFYRQVQKSYPWLDCMGISALVKI